MKAFFAAALFLSLASAHAADTDLIGTYTGCGVSALGARQANFHIIQLPTGFGVEEAQYVASFRWADTELSGLYFTDVKLNADRTKMLMRFEYSPRREYGTLVDTILVDILPGGTLVGVHRSNALGGNGLPNGGTWKVQKVAEGQQIPKLNCR